MFNRLNHCTLALMLLTSSMSFSRPVLPTKVVDLNYLYKEDDMLQVLQNRVGHNPNIYIVLPIAEIESDSTKDLMAQACINNVVKIVNQGIPVQDIKVLISNFYGNNRDENGYVVGHWTAAVIRKDKSGSTTLYYNDPTGNPYNPDPKTLLAKIIRLMRGVVGGDILIRDLQVHQQSDAVSCGAFTAEDLVVLAEMNDNELTLESAKALLSNITDAKMLRNKHAGIVTQENIKYDEYVFNSAEDKEFAQQLSKALPGSDAYKFGASFDELSNEQVKEVFSKLLDRPKERNSEIIRISLRHVLTDIHNSAMSAIHSRLSNGPLIVATGDDDDVAGDTWQHGVWARASISHSKDKANNKTAEYFSGYKTKGHSNTIGVDSLINDNLLMGLAYTNAYTSIKLQNQNAGNVDKARTNMFSLYGSYNIPNYNWFVDGTISYAESVIRGKNIRNGDEASSKYKSHLYSGSVSLVYNYHTSNDIYITPSLGMTGSLIKDSGYKETGTNFQNLNIAKKHYNKLSSTLGVRTFKNINQGKLTITPELYSFINYSLKNKTPSINAQLQGIDATLPTINFKSNKVDYNLGVGISLKHNMMEYGVNYTVTFAKKYEAHSGSLKVRVNF